MLGMTEMAALHDQVAATNVRLDRIEALLAELVAIANLFTTTEEGDDR